MAKKTRKSKPETQHYVSPLVERNASREMAELFGAQKKFSTKKVQHLAQTLAGTGKGTEKTRPGYKTKPDKPDGQTP